MYARALTHQEPYCDHRDMVLVHLACYDHGIAEFAHLDSSGCRLVREYAESAFTDDGIKGAIGDWKTFSIPLLEGHEMGDAHLCCCLCGLLDCFSAVLNAQHLTAKTLCKRDGTPSLSRCDIQNPLLRPEME